MNFRTSNDRVLVRRVEPEERTALGIIMPDSAKEKLLERLALCAGGVIGEMDF